MQHCQPDQRLAHCSPAIARQRYWRLADQGSEQCRQTHVFRQRSAAHRIARQPSRESEQNCS